MAKLSLLLAFPCLIALIPSAGAQTITARNTHQSYSGFNGAGFNTSSPSGSHSDTGLVLSDSDFLNYSDSRSGVLSGDPWSISVASAAQQSFAIAGSLSNFTSISAAGSTMCSAFASGPAIAQMGSSNELDIYFTMNSSATGHLSGSVVHAPVGQNLRGLVALERFEDGLWRSVYSTLLEPDQQGTFDLDVDLTAGEYRMIGSAGGLANAAVTPLTDNSFNYQLSLRAVPEPFTMALGMAAAGLFIRRRKRTHAR